jgi:multisubunit Na+/H+ antiporter MnhC subunit
MFWSTPGRGLWMAPATAGIALVLLGVLLFEKPELLAYFVAGTFIVAGVSLIVFAMGLRRKVTYRRIDHFWRVDDDLS